MIQKLNDNEIPPTHTMPLSGHKNVQSITNYSSLNLNHQKKKHIGHLKPIASFQTQVTTQTTTHETAAATTSKNRMRFFDGAVISGGKFTISINTLQTTSLTTFESRSSVTETTENR